MYNTLISLMFSIIFSSFTHLSAQENQPEELGQVHWYRNYDEAIAAAKKEKKDILILFQEIPGCSTCRNYGHNVLSHPLMVEAIENSFIPLAIYNNKGGEDKKILAQFNEPSWNNPVVRIIDTLGKDIAPRVAGDYSAAKLCTRMVGTLVVRQSVVPNYLLLLELELFTLQQKRIAEKHFKMYCFWTGEKELGKLDGVLKTESGFIKNDEVVKVSYDPTIISEKQLIGAAEQKKMTPVSRNIEKYTIAAKDLHYYLQHSDYKYLALTEHQKTKINSALGRNLSAEKYLSPTQKKYFHHLTTDKKEYPVLFYFTFEDAWAKMKMN